MKYELPTTWDQKVQIRMYNHLKDKFIKYLRYMFKKNNYFLVNYLKKKEKSYRVCKSMMDKSKLKINFLLNGIFEYIVSMYCKNKKMNFFVLG